MARKPASQALSAPTKRNQSPAQLANLRMWGKGQSGNPKGRPKGSRNKLAEHFIADLQADWEEHGVEAIKQMRENNPADYVKVVAGILPKELNVKTSVVEELSDDELAAGIAALQSLIAAQAVGEGEGAATKH